MLTLKLLPAPGSWMDSAQCVGLPTELFFDTTYAGHAKSVCGACEVREQCLEYALTQEVHGVWGGLTDRERTKLRSRARSVRG